MSTRETQKDNVLPNKVTIVQVQIMAKVTLTEMIKKPVSKQWDSKDMSSHLPVASDVQHSGLWVASQGVTLVSHVPPPGVF